MTDGHQQWLALTQEEVIEPELPICDPHHHLWDWTEERHPNERYLLDDLLGDTGSGHHVIRTVFVECGAMYRAGGPQEVQPVGETEFVETIAIESERSRNGGPGAVIAGIVGHVNLSLGAAVTPVLEAHLEASPTRFRGIRHMLCWDASGMQAKRTFPPPGLMLDKSFREGFACLQRYGLSFEAWLYHPQLPDLIELARAFPETAIVLNHIGGPIGIGPYAEYRAAVFNSWQYYMAVLATCPNVVVKLGGMGMPMCGFDWHERSTPPGSAELAKAMGPYYLWCIEQFGVERCMFESNFPVDNVSYSYAVVWNAFKRIVRDFSPNEKAALFHDTAAKVYRLTSAGTPGGD
jgi:predicted TIM-barrel fold metal-dependent hydrolase